MKIAILGYAGQGQSSFRYWNTPENDVTICDADAHITVPDGVKTRLGSTYLDNLDSFDLLIRTPALHPKLIKEANPNTPNILSKVWSNTNEFFKVCPTKNIIGVTGTKGKGTTSTLVVKMLEAAGKKVFLGGNIGTPPLDLLNHPIGPDDWVVLELANFQLIDLKYSPRIAACLMIEPEHLNWHNSLDEYIEAKSQLFKWQNENDIAIYYHENTYSKKIVSPSRGLLIPYMSEPGAYVQEETGGKTYITIDSQVICETDDIQLPGKHNWQNVCAAVTVVWNITHQTNAIKDAIRDFKSLPHRLEKIREVDGVTYYNDSFSSAPGATIAAINAVPGSKIMIVGGVDKNLDLSELARTILLRREEIRRIVIIGAVGDKLSQVLSDHGVAAFDLLKNVDMAAIVNHAKNLAQPGDSIVLSPGTSSFDMFKNFEDRGDQFKDAVNSL